MHPRLSGEVVEDEVPPVPPLPAGVTPSPRPLSTGQIASPPRPQSEPMPVGMVKHANRASTGRKRGVDVTALLGSIDAVAGRGGLRKPPY